MIEYTIKIIITDGEETVEQDFITYGNNIEEITTNIENNLDI